ncbi:MAG: methyltransferase domain-containing protein [Rudaea sp.]
MPTDPNSFYTSAPVRRLFAQELLALTPILGGVYGNFGLFLRAHASAPATLPSHLLGNIIDLALEDSRQFGGRLQCAPDELPLASESCKLVIAQHVFERIDDADACAGELARVLAPEGVALVLGFNPLSLWRPWLAGKARGAALQLRPGSAQGSRKIFSRHGIETLQTRFLGAAVPWRRRDDESMHSDEWRSPLFGRMGGSWLLLARKQRSTLTPLRLRRNSRELALNPHLAPGARRECA